MDAQKDKLKKYAEFQDMEIVGEYSDEGHSGKNIKGRQEFMRMLNDIEEGKDGVDFVLVFKLSRFGRNAEDEVEIIQMIFDRYIHTNDGINGVANYLSNHGYTKKLCQNGTIPGFSASFIKKIIDNPVYMGKIAYGRRRTEKKTGTRNETHVVEQSDFPVYEGVREAIIAEEDRELAQEKRSKNNYRREKIHDPEHAHILSGILKCPCCGKGMYGNIAKAGRYACKDDYSNDKRRKI